MTLPKICIFTETFYPVVGGGETQALLLAEGLAARGYSVMILTRRSDQALAKVEKVGRATVCRLAPVGRGQLKKWGLLFSSLPALIRLRRHYDVLFISGFRIIGLTSVPVARLLGKSVVIKADSQGEMSGEFFRRGLSRIRLAPDRFPFKLFLKLRNHILRRADAFTAISADVAAEMTGNGVDPCHIHYIANGVDTTRFFPVEAERKHELRRQLGLPANHKIAVYTGRLVSYKGLPLLLQVWRAFYHKHPDSSLLLLGTGGLDIHNCEAELKAYAADNHLQSTVYFLGAVRNVPCYLQAADLFVFPTEEDAFPSSLIEAMACSLPVITTPVGAIKSIIRDGQNGVSIDPKSFEQLFNALEKVFDDDQLAAELGHSGWQTVREQYSAKVVTDKYAALFDQLAAAKV